MFPWIDLLICPDGKPGVVRIECRFADHDIFEKVSTENLSNFFARLSDRLRVYLATGRDEGWPSAIEPVSTERK